MRPTLSELAFPKNAVKFLGNELFEGSLALFLGAGISKPLGLPTFGELLNHCFRSLGEPDYTGPDLELGATRLAGLCEQKQVKLLDIVYDGLYRGDGVTAIQLTTSPRLGAIGAMLMGSRRGSVGTVVTFNYDSVLEEYLLLHGYLVNVVTSQPALTGRGDVTVFHPHGYLPSITGPGSATQNLVFTKESINEMLGNPNHPWPRVLREIIRSKVVVLLGISEQTAVSQALGPILAAEAPDLKQTRPSAFWIGAQAPDEDRRRVLSNANTVTVALGSHDQLENFLLEICREAARKMLS